MGKKMSDGEVLSFSRVGPEERKPLPLCLYSGNTLPSQLGHMFHPEFSLTSDSKGNNGQWFSCLLKLLSQIHRACQSSASHLPRATRLHNDEEALCRGSLVLLLILKGRRCVNSGWCSRVHPEDLIPEQTKIRKMYGK